MVVPPLSHFRWHPLWRIVATRHPRVGVYDRVVPSHQQKDVRELEQLTNPRAQAERGEVHFLRPGDRFTDASSAQIRATFAYAAPSRFGDGRYPVLYAAREIETAIAEKRYHLAQFLKAHETPATSQKQSSFELALDGELHDVRGSRFRTSGIYASENYNVSQSLGRELWKAGSPGLVYNSVRRTGGECVAVFSPQLLTACARASTYEFVWDGSVITDVFKLERLDN